jgi:hypothetical protein
VGVEVVERIEARLNAHIPKYMFSLSMKEAMIATRIMVRGLKAVTKTGPLSFIITP